MTKHELLFLFDFSVARKGTLVGIENHHHHHHGRMSVRRFISEDTAGPMCSCHVVASDYSGRRSIVRTTQSSALVGKRAEKTAMWSMAPDRSRRAQQPQERHDRRWSCAPLGERAASSSMLNVENVLSEYSPHCL